MWGAYLAWANAQLNNAGRVPLPDMGPDMAGVDLTAGVVVEQTPPPPTGGFVDTPPGGSEVRASEDREWAGSETFRRAWEVAQRDGAVIGVRAYCEGNTDIDQCRAMLSLLDGAQWHTDVLTQALADIDRLGMYLLDELGEISEQRGSVDIALRLLREAAAKPARIETSMLAAVSGDLAGLADTLKGGARASLAAMALWLAEVIDKRGGEAGPTTSARLAQELRATLVALTTEKSDDVNAVQRFLDMVSTPVRDAADPGAPNAGPEGGGDSAGDGQAPDAASAVHGRRRPGD
jgi:hypothetical protein